MSVNPHQQPVYVHRDPLNLIEAVKVVIKVIVGVLYRFVPILFLCRKGTHSTHTRALFLSLSPLSLK